MTDRLNPERTDRDIARIILLAAELRHAWGHAVDGGTWMPRSNNGGRGSGFTDLKPTETAALSPTQRQLRSKARRAAELISHAVADLDEAAVVVANGLLQTDHDEWVRVEDKRAAATQRR